MAADIDTLEGRIVAMRERLSADYQDSLTRLDALASSQEGHDLKAARAMLKWWESREEGRHQCSFCGKHEDDEEVTKLIKAYYLPHVYICDLCTGVCGGIVQDLTQAAAGATTPGDGS
jgi:hypothetical protein